MQSSQVVAALQGALEVALENLPDVAGDSSFGADGIIDCCADIAALRQLLSPVTGAQAVNIQAYLGE